MEPTLNGINNLYMAVTYEAGYLAYGEKVSKSRYAWARILADRGWGKRASNGFGAWVGEAAWQREYARTSSASPKTNTGPRSSSGAGRTTRGRKLPSKSSATWTPPTLSSLVVGLSDSQTDSSQEQ